MSSQLSISRKGENLYLKLHGNLNEVSSEEILVAIKRLVNTSLLFSSSEGQVEFTFQTHATGASRKTGKGAQKISAGS